MLETRRRAALTKRCACCALAKVRSSPSRLRFTSTTSRAIPWREIACSRASSVRGTSHRCRSCTLACHVSLTATLLHLSQLRALMTNSTTSERCSVCVPDNTSDATVSLTLSRRLFGSVQIQPAST